MNIIHIYGVLIMFWQLNRLCNFSISKVIWSARWSGAQIRSIFSIHFSLSVLVFFTIVPLGLADHVFLDLWDLDEDWNRLDKLPIQLWLLLHIINSIMAAAKIWQRAATSE